MITFATVSPCYNEEEVIEQSVGKLTALFVRLIGEGKISPESKMVFVNDGSTDKTWEKICELKKINPYVKGIKLSRNVGHQHALMAGLMNAKEWADAVVSVDADLQDDINVIPEMIDDVSKGYDVVYGVKVSRTADPLLKRVSAEAFYKLQSSMGVESVFNHADFRMMTKKALDMLSNYKEKNLYLRGLIPLIGLKSTTVDDVISERTAGHSKYNLKRMLSLAVDGITSFSTKPLKIIFVLGVLSIIIALIVAIDVFHALFIGEAVAGWATVVLSIWLVGGMALISLSVVGEYIGKIYTEVKNRPLYNIEEEI